MCRPGTRRPLALLDGVCSTLNGVCMAPVSMIPLLLHSAAPGCAYRLTFGCQNGTMELDLRYGN